MTETPLPLIARIAGLPGGFMAPFGSDRWDGHFERLRSLEQEAQTRRSALTDELHAALPASSPEHRRILLELKRDSFNGRPLQKYALKAPWLGTQEPVASLLADILRLDEEIREAKSEIEATYQTERNRERRHLSGLVGDLHFMRGVTLSSLSLVENAERLVRTPPDAYGRRERRLETSLLRYASRAALKLSPFSTLTRVGLAEVRPAEPGAPGLELPHWGSWNEQSRVCLRRFLLDQSSEYLARHRPFRERLRIVLNDTAERFPNDLYRFLRTGYWDYDAEAREIRHHMPALVKVRLAGPLIEWLARETQQPQRTYRHLLDEAQKAFPKDSPQTLEATLDKLLEIGFLRFAWPWSPDDLHLETSVLERSEALDPAAGLRPFAEILRRVVELLESYPAIDRPAAVVAETRTAVESLVRTAAAVGGIEGVETKIKGTTGYYFQEDVFLHPAAPSGEAQPVVRLSQDKAREILCNVDPLVRLSNLENRRYEFLHTLSAFASDRWPGQSEVGFVELFDASHKLFQEYVRFEIDARKYPRFRAPAFNPLGLKVIERVHAHRLEIADRFRACLEPDGDVMRLDKDALGALLDEVPGPYAASRDFCAFVQPLDMAGDRWVLNSLFEGAGRLSSRYTLVMDEPTRATWVSFFEGRSQFRQDGEDVELVDMFCPAGHTLNIHAAQTRRVLEIPGESSSLPETRRLRLGDLRFRLSGPDRFPRLTDTSGRRLLPVHLGGLIFRFMPHLIKFLITFGPGEFRYSAPCQKPLLEGDVSVMDRHAVGNVVYWRKSWTFETASLRSNLQGLSEVEAFDAIQRWRQERGIPHRVFLVAPLSRTSSNPQMKPQFIELNSPLFVDLFRSSLDTVLPRLTMTEVLPGPEHFPRGQDGSAWALELQLDSFGFPSFVGSVPPLCAGECRINVSLKGAHMDEKKDQSAEIENLNIEPLSDEDLESVAGGEVMDSCSCCGENSGCTGDFAEAI